MSVQAVTYSQIVCDTCGQHRDDIHPDPTAARISASQDGWKYVAWNIKGLGLQKRRPAERPRGVEDYQVDTVPRQWDCCPACLLPESPVEAAAIRKERKERNHLGKWVDKEAAS